ncbi:MAG: oxidoreductase [Rhizobiaceae bacterium]|nr:oxidoreductase [Rhizobiaceae bacterium]
MSLRLSGKTECAEGIAAFELVDPLGRDLPVFMAGAHLDVHLPNGMVRQYSLRNAPAERHRYCLGVLREPYGRGGSAAMHGLAAGDTVEVGMPRNNFVLEENAPVSLLVAGGIGVTPLLAMAHRLTELGRDFTFHYAARSAARMAFREEIEASAFAHRAHFHLDDGPGDQRLDLEAIASAGRPGARLYVCGPSGFMDAVIDAARRGWPEEAIRREYFAAAPITRRDADDAFRVRLALSGRSLEVPAGCTIVEALAAIGLEVPTSCEQGICGTCVTKVLSGTPDHRDLVLTDRERADRMTLCCSRALSDEIVLEL